MRLRSDALRALSELRRAGRIRDVVFEEQDLGVSFVLARFDSSMASTMSWEEVRRRRDDATVGCGQEDARADGRTGRHCWE